MENRTVTIIPNRRGVLTSGNLRDIGNGNQQDIGNGNQHNDGNGNPQDEAENRGNELVSSLFSGSILSPHCFFMTPVKNYVSIRSPVV